MHHQPQAAGVEADELAAALDPDHLSADQVLEGGLHRLEGRERGQPALLDPPSGQAVGELGGQGLDLG
jgi:hypothetical protein